MSNILESYEKEALSRRKVVRGIGVLTLLSVIVAAIKLPIPRKKNMIACQPDAKNKKVKMLTEDGRLVEIDGSLLASNKKKISNKELQQWIKK